MRQPRPLVVSAISLSAASGILWGIAIASMWVQVPTGTARVVLGGAITTAVISALLWLGRSLLGRVDVALERFRLRGEHDDVYIQTLAWITRPVAAAVRRTGPLRRVR